MWIDLCVVLLSDEKGVVGTKHIVVMIQFLDWVAVELEAYCFYEAKHTEHDCSRAVFFCSLHLGKQLCAVDYDFLFKFIGL